MRIAPIRPYNYRQISFQSNLREHEKFAEPFSEIKKDFPSFQISQSPPYFPPSAFILEHKDLINSKVSLEMFKNLSDETKEDIYSKIPFPIKLVAGENLSMAMIFKNALDEKYGEGKYKFVSVGTSPSCIAKALEYMGEDVVYMPMSFAHTTCSKHWLYNNSYNDMYIDYLDKQGLSNEKLRKEDKVAVVCDYTFSGRSLELAQSMLKHAFYIDSDRVKSISMNEIITDSEDLDNETKKSYLSEMLKKQDMAHYSDIPHFDFLDDSFKTKHNIKTSNDLIEYFDNYTGKYSNSHNFALLTLLEKYHLYLKNPAD